MDQLRQGKESSGEVAQDRDARKARVRGLQDLIYWEAYNLLLSDGGVERRMQALALIYGALRLYPRALEELVGVIKRRGAVEGAFFALHLLSHPKHAKRPVVNVNSGGLYRLAEEALQAGASPKAVFRVLASPSPLTPFIFSLSRRNDPLALARTFEAWGGEEGVKALARMAWLAGEERGGKGTDGREEGGKEGG